MKTRIYNRDKEVIYESETAGNVGRAFLEALSSDKKDCLKRAVIDGVNFKNIKIEDIDLQGIIFKNCTFDECKFVRVNLAYSNLATSKITKSEISWCDLDKAVVGDISGSILYNNFFDTTKLMGEYNNNMFYQNYYTHPIFSGKFNENTFSNRQLSNNIQDEGDMQPNLYFAKFDKAVFNNNEFDEIDIHQGSCQKSSFSDNKFDKSRFNYFNMDTSKFIGNTFRDCAFKKPEINSVDFRNNKFRGQNSDSIELSKALNKAAEQEQQATNDDLSM